MEQGRTKPLRDFKGGGKNILETGLYKFHAREFDVKTNTPSGFPLVVIQSVVVGPSMQAEFYGQTIELAFSLAAEGVAKSWLVALGFEEDDEIPMDGDDLQAYLNRKAKGSIFSANIQKTKDKSGKYDQNQVDAPWENVFEDSIKDGDQDYTGVKVGSSDEPPF